MDPFLEGYLWPDVHHELASVIKELLVPQIRPTYVARVNLYTVADTSPEEDVGIMYPDVEVLRRKNQVREAIASYAGEKTKELTPPTTSIPDTTPVEVRIPVVEIHDREHNRLITAIEILSPVNKRSPGLEPYREKRQRLHAAGVHLLEIDLLRRGERPLPHPYLPIAHYLIFLTRAGQGSTDIWAVNVQDTLPVLPVPLRSPDPDARLDLGRGLAIIYERSQYELSIDYGKNPPLPDFSEEDRQWMSNLLKAAKE